MSNRMKIEVTAKSDVMEFDIQLLDNIFALIDVPNFDTFVLEFFTVSLERFISEELWKEKNFGRDLPVDQFLLRSHLSKYLANLQDTKYRPM